MKIHPSSRYVLMLSLSLLLTACVTDQAKVGNESQGATTQAAGSSDVASALQAAEAARAAGKPDQALIQYRRLQGISNPPLAAAAMMGRFMLRIDPQSSVRDTDKARKIAAQMDTLAKQSENPVAIEFSAAAQMRLGLQDSINALVKQASDVSAKLQATEAELKQRDLAISKLRRALTN